MQSNERKTRQWIAAVVLGALVVAMCLTARRAAIAQEAPAAAAPAGAKNIAVANVARIFAEMQETKDLQTRMLAEGRAIMQQDQERSNKLKELQSARDLTKANTPQWDAAHKTLRDGRVEYRVWVETTRADLDNRQKQQTKDLYDKIVATIAEIANQRGIELVVADKQQLSTENVEKMSVDDFRGMLSQREVLFASAGSDITSEVIALLDAKFKEGK